MRVSVPRQLAAELRGQRNLRVLAVLLVKVTDLSLCRYGAATAGALCACFGVCKLLVTVVPAFQEIVNCHRSYCLKEIVLLIDGVPHQLVKAKVQGYILNAERRWEKRERQEGIQLPEGAVALGDARIAAFRQSKD